MSEYNSNGIWTGWSLEAWAKHGPIHVDFVKEYNQSMREAFPPLEKAYPPSGMILMLCGVELNTAPRDLLLQVIEANMADRLGRLKEHEDKAAELKNKLYRRLWKMTEI